MAKKIGRPTKYRPEYVDQVEELARRGMTNEELAKFFKVNVDTIYEWQKVHSSFSDALKRGKDYHDSGMVENALLRSALGYRYKEQTSTKNGIVELEKEAHPNPTSMIYWLKNRDQKRWRDKQESDASQEVLNKLDTVLRGIDAEME